MTKRAKANPTPPTLTAGGLFAGIGGLELGFEKAGFATQFLCEIDPDARKVLTAHFDKVPLYGDVCEMRALPSVSVLAAGFPCQDLSAVGPRHGLNGTKSSLVGRLFELVGAAKPKPEWIVLENVPFMLQLNKGGAVASITQRLEELGYEWAYRVVDTRAFGLPQRRRRVFIVATNGEVDPSAVLFADDAPLADEIDDPELACGFYWTEGNTGVGWAVDAIPTLKGGSALSIPSPPAIWLRHSGDIVLPDIRDAERLQGFQANWTLAVEAGDRSKRRRRWRLVGNAVSVPVAKWLAGRIAKPGTFDPARLVTPNTGWPSACRGGRDGRFEVKISEWPVSRPRRHLADFLKYGREPISTRAAKGFLLRARKSSLRFTDGFLEAVADAAGVDREEARRVRFHEPQLGLPLGVTDGGTTGEPRQSTFNVGHSTPARPRRRGQVSSHQRRQNIR